VGRNDGGGGGSGGEGGGGGGGGEPTSRKSTDAHAGVVVGGGGGGDSGKKKKKKRRKRPSIEHVRGGARPLEEYSPWMREAMRCQTTSSDPGLQAFCKANPWRDPLKPAGKS